MVSFIIPCYNAEKYLDDCIGSLLNQTLQDIEIICVDDGSTDHTLSMLNRYAELDKRLCVLSQQNQFAGAARNLGLSKAKGEYLIFLDADDFFSETLAQDAYTAAVSADADVVLFNAQFYDESTNKFRKGWFLNTGYIPEKQPFSYEDCPDYFYQITSPVPWTKMFRRQFLLDTKLQFQTLRHTNDTFCILSALAMAKRIVTLDKVLVNYRVGHATNLQSTKRTEPFCFYAAYKAWHDKLDELGLFPVLHRSYANQAMGGCLYNLRTMNGTDAQKNVFDRLRQEIFGALDIPDDDASYYHIDTNYNEMRLIKHGTFEQYCAFQTSPAIRELWNNVERGCRSISSEPCGSRARRAAVYAVIERLVKKVKTYAAEHPESVAKYAYQMVHHAFNRNEFSDVTLQTLQNKVLYRGFVIIQRHGYEKIKAMLNRKMIVSLTTYPARIHSLAPVLESLYNQDRKADEIVLWLAEEEFPGKEQDLPVYLTELVSQQKLTIRWCDNLKPHKKYFYAFQEYADDLIVTVDDDLLYSKNMLSSLYNSYLMYPDAVSAVRVHLMLLSEDGNILPYNAWIRETDCCLLTPSMQLFATGGAGTLYPPELFRKEFLDRDAINENSPLADDLWLKAMELLSGVPVVAARLREPLEYVPGSQGDALKHVNDEQKQNDVQLGKIIQWTDRVFGQGSLVRALTEPAVFHSILDKETVAYHLDQERRGLRQQIVQMQSREADLLKKLAEKEELIRNKEESIRKLESKQKETERKLHDEQLKLEQTRRQLKLERESKPIGRQMEALGKELRGLREKGHSAFSVASKLLVYKIAWIPEKMLVFLMYYLRNGLKQTIRYLLGK